MLPVLDGLQGDNPRSIGKFVQPDRCDCLRHDGDTWPLSLCRDCLGQTTDRINVSGGRFALSIAEQNVMASISLSPTDMRKASIACDTLLRAFALKAPRLYHHSEIATNSKR